MSNFQAQLAEMEASLNGSPNSANKQKRDAQGDRQAPQQSTNADKFGALASTAKQDAGAMGSAIALLNSNTAQGLQGFIERDEELTEAVAQEVATRLRTRAQRIAHRVVQLMIAPPEVEIGDIFAETSPLDTLLFGSQTLTQIGGASNADSH